MEVRQAILILHCLELDLLDAQLADGLVETASGRVVERAVAAATRVEGDAGGDVAGARGGGSRCFGAGRRRARCFGSGCRGSRRLSGAGAVVVSDLLSEPQATASKPSAATAASEVNRLLVRICSPPWSVCLMDGNIQRRSVASVGNPVPLPLGPVVLTQVDDVPRPCTTTEPAPTEPCVRDPTRRRRSGSGGDAVPALLGSHRSRRRAGSVDTSRSDCPKHLAGARRQWWRTADSGVNVDVHHGAQAEGEDRAVGGRPGGAVRRRRQRRRHVRARTSTN